MQQVELRNNNNINNMDSNKDRDESTLKSQQQQSADSTPFDLTKNSLTLPEMTTFDENNPMPLSPLASLERCISNPLVRGYSNVSVSSDNEGAHFVPFGRGHDDIARSDKPLVDPLNPLSRFEFSNPNIAGLVPQDSLEQEYLNCITPVQSKVANNNNQAIRIQQAPLGPLEDIDGHSTDFDARTDRTGTSDAHSSQIASSQDGLLPPIGNGNRGGTMLPEDHLNVNAQPFVPDFGAPPQQQQQQMNMNMQQQIIMQQNADLQQQLPSWQAVPNQNAMPPQQQQQPPMMNMNNMNNGMMNMPPMQQPMNMMNINVNIPPQMNQNGVQGSPGRYTPDMMGQQQQGHNSPNTPFRKNSGGSYDGIMQNYMNNTVQPQNRQNQNQSRSPELAPRSNGSRTPNDGYGQQGQQQPTWGNMRNNNSNNSNQRQNQNQQQNQNQRRNNNNNNNGRYQTKNNMRNNNNNNQNNQNNQQQQQQNSQNIQNMEITDIIKMNLSLPVLLQHNMICKFMKHQNGSRYIQEKLKTANNELTLAILRHIIFKQKQILSLSEDIFGNYVIQIFFENGTAEQHQLLIENLLYTNVYRLSRSFYGCRVIQKAFDCIDIKESIKLILELENEGKKRKVDGNNGNDNDGNNKSLIHECIICPNANHVIQKIITLELDIKYIQFIIKCIKTNLCFYSSHIFGCRIVQNIINYYGDHDNKRMLKEMVSKDNLLHLCQSQYGNYVIQHILKLSFKNGQDKCENIKQQVVNNVFRNVLYLSKNKYGSNVVENCLEFADDKDRDLFLDQILNKKSKQILCEMVKHKYANYVIQKLLNYCNVKQQQRLIHHIERNIPNLRTMNYGKHIMDKIKKIKQQHGSGNYNDDNNNHHSRNNKRYYNNY